MVDYRAERNKHNGSNLLLPFLQGILRSNTKPMSSGDSAYLSEWREAWESFVVAAIRLSRTSGYWYISEI